MGRLIFTLADRHSERLRDLSEVTQLSQAELLRRMMDQCFQEKVLNELVPAMSGQLSLGSLK